MKNKIIKNKDRRKELIRDMIIFAFIILFAVTYFYLDPSITGRVVFGTQIETDRVFTIQIADVLNLSLISPANGTNINNNSIILNATQEGNVSKFIIYGGNSSNLNYNNILYINFSISGVQANNITYNFSALPINPDGTDGLVLLHHYDNASIYENYTYVLDFSNSEKALNNGTYQRWNISQQSFGNSTYGRFGNSFLFNGINNYISVNNSASLQIVQNITLSAWIKFDYNTTNYSSIYTNISSQGIIDKGDYGLYFDENTGTINFKLDNKSAVENWTLSYDGAGNSTLALREYNGYLYAGKGSTTREGDIYYCNPAFNTSGTIEICDPDEWFLSYNGAQEEIRSLEVFNGKLYAGQGITDGDADIFVCFANNTGNVNICDGNSDWVQSYNPPSIYNFAQTLLNYNGKLYVGFGDTVGESDIFVCKPNVTGNDKICDSGDWNNSLNLAATTVRSLREYNGKLYAGLGDGSGSADIYICNPEINTTNLGEGLTECDPDEWQLFFDGSTRSIESMEEFNGRLYAGFGRLVDGSGDIYVCDETLNTTGDRIICDRDEWIQTFNAAEDVAFTLKSYNGKLYAGEGDDAGEGNIYVCDPARNTTGNIYVCDRNEWTISYDGIAKSVSTLNVYNGKLYAGTGSSNENVTDDILVLGYNNSETVNSTTTIWEKDRWYHVAATYNGSSMNLYVNGILEGTKAAPMLIEQNITNLFVGYDSGYGYFNGTIDEVAIWNRSLSKEEIDNLYSIGGAKYYWKANATDTGANINTTAIQEFEILSQPLISLEFPTNNSILNTKSANLIYLPRSIGNSTINNCTLYIDDNLNQTDTSITEYISNLFSMNLQEKSFSWFVGCRSSQNIQSNSSTFFFTVDSTYPNLTLNSPLNASNIINLSTTLNITTADSLSNVTKLIIYVGNSSDLDYNNVLYINYSVINGSSFNITYNFSALPINPDGSDGLVLLHHYDNASPYENYTYALDFSNSEKALNNGTYERWNISQQSFGNSTYGRFGNSFLFNGINNYILVNNSASLQIVQNITLSAWIKFDYNTTNYSSIYTNISSQGIIDKGDYGLYFDENTGTINFKLDNKSAVENWTLSYNGAGNLTYSLKEYNGYLYAGKGNASREGDIYYCNPAFNTTGSIKICDPDEWFLSYDGNNNTIFALEVFNSKLYMGQGSLRTGDGDIYVCFANNTGNINICDGNSDWAISYNGAEEEILSLYKFNGRLYAGQGSGSNDGDLFICRPNQTGDINLCDNNDWGISRLNAATGLTSIKSFNNKLYFSQGKGSQSADLEVCNPELNTTNLGEGLKECDRDEWMISSSIGAYGSWSLETFNGYLFSGGFGAPPPTEILMCNPIYNLTGDNTICDGNNEWFTVFDSSEAKITSLKAYNGKLYIGEGNSFSSGGSILVCNPSANQSNTNLTSCEKNYFEWNRSFLGSGGEVNAFEIFNGHLYAGVGLGYGNVTDDILVLGYNNSETVNSTTTIWEKDRWYHVAATYNGSSMNLYVNGILEGTKAAPMMIEQNITNLFVGYDSGYGYFNGTIDEIAIWNRSLSDIEVANLFNLSYKKYFWKANGTDLAGNTNNTGIFEFNLTTGVSNTAPNNATPYIFAQPFTSNTVIRTNSSLNASSFVQDPNADSMIAEIVFWRNTTVEHFRINRTNIASSSNASYTLTENQTNKFFKGENWTAAFRVNDGTISSNWVNASILISNTQPENSNTTIRPLSPIKTDSLNCSFTYIDTNNDAGIATIIWYNNSKEHFRTNISIANNSNNTIVSYTLTRNNTNAFLRSETWTCAAIVNDGVINSDWFNASVTIQNIQPNNASPIINPNNPDTNDDLNASSLISDSDADLMTAEIVFWNGSREHFRTNITSISNNSYASYKLIKNSTNIFTSGENWTAAFKVTDNSSSSSDWVNASVLIASATSPVVTEQTQAGGSSSGISSGFEEKSSIQSVELLQQGNLYQYKLLAPGQNVIELNDKLLSTESLNIFASNLMNDVEIKIEELERLPSKYTKDLNYAHKYISIETHNFLDSLVTNRELVFKLSKSLTKDKKASLYLFEETKDKWIKLNTFQIKDESNFVYYKAILPHLSLFAIKLDNTGIDELVKLEDIREKISDNFDPSENKSLYERFMLLSFLLIVLFNIILLHFVLLGLAFLIIWPFAEIIKLINKLSSKKSKYTDFANRIEFSTNKILSYIEITLAASFIIYVLIGYNINIIKTNITKDIIISMALQAANILLIAYILFLQAELKRFRGKIKK